MNDKPTLKTADEAAEAIVQKFDVNTLTLGEVAAIEELSGLGIGALSDDDKPKGLFLAALVYVIKRRQNVKYTFGMAQLVTLGDVTAMIGDDEDEGPSD